MTVTLRDAWLTGRVVGRGGVPLDCGGLEVVGGIGAGH
jgi:hypothetical protein